MVKEIEENTKIIRHRACAGAVIAQVPRAVNLASVELLTIVESPHEPGLGHSDEKSQVFAGFDGQLTVSLSVEKAQLTSSEEFRLKPLPLTLELRNENVWDQYAEPCGVRQSHLD